jgi:hypothetical protein
MGNSGRRIRAAVLGALIGVFWGTTQGLAKQGMITVTPATTAATDVPEAEAPADASKDAPQASKTFESIVAKMEKTEGLFTFYRSKKTGALFIAFKAQQLAEGAQFIYHAQIVNSVAGMPLPQLGDYARPHIMSFRRHYGRVEFLKENTSYYFNPASPLARASDANIQPAIVGLGRVIAVSKDGNEILVDVDSLFRSETLQQIAPLNAMSLSPNPFVSKIEKVRSYARNSQVIVAHAYDTDGSMATRDVPDARVLTTTIQHSFIALPEPGFKPRRDDYRVGYFTNRITDLTSQGQNRWADLIERWRLEKKDPGAALSDPVKPITFWIQNTTPLGYRDTIIEAGLGWNAAFESAGFTNAVEIKVQPDDANWDADNIEYNVLRWVSTPSSFYYGMGPSLADPRTGEIISADIMLENNSLRGMSHAFEVLSSHEPGEAPGGDIATMLREYADERGVTQGAGLTRHRCRIDADLASFALLPSGLSAGETHVSGPGLTEGQLTPFTRQILKFLITHEMGHTLGLAHNFIASTYIDYDKIHNQSDESEGFLSASIMDYPELNVAAKGKKQGLYFPTRPGPYDHWAIEFGYTPQRDDAALQALAREAILARSLEPGLAYSSSRLDPRVAVWDLSDDPISFAIDRTQVIEERLKVIRSETVLSGDNRDLLFNSVASLLGQKDRQARTMVRFIGGVYEEHADVGQSGATTPYRPVSLADQKRVMAALSKHFLAPGAYDLPDDLVADLQHRRRGFITSTLGLSRAIKGRQVRVLFSLMNVGTTQRLSEARIHGGAYDVAMLLDDLTRAVFEDDLALTVDTNRKALQSSYVDALIYLALSGVQDAEGEAAALQELIAVEKMMGKMSGADVATRAHQSHLQHEIRTQVFLTGGKPKSVDGGWSWFNRARGLVDEAIGRAALYFVLGLMSLSA